MRDEFVANVFLCAKFVKFVAVSSDRRRGRYVRVVRGSSFFKPTQPSTRNLIELHTTNNKPSGTRKTIFHNITVSESLSSITYLSV